MLTSSQLYYIKKAKDRKAFRLLAIIRRKNKGQIYLNKRHIKLKMNEDLHKQFKIVRLGDLDDSQYEEYLNAIRNYQFIYEDKSYQ